jgi:hypothetical protein
MTMSNTGGPAFPTTVHNYGDGMYASEGLSIRDYFAAKAMQGLISDEDWRESADWREEKFEESAADYTACAAYVMADAMLRAREGK